MLKTTALALLFFPTFLSATTYHVSNTGNDNNSGTTPAAAWRTVAKVNADTGKIKPGDSVLFERGGLWREYLNFNASGTATSPILVADYGTGELPVLSAANTVNGWNLVAKGGFSAYVAPLATAPANVFEDGNFLGYQPVKTEALLTRGSYFYDSTNKLLYVRMLEDNPAYDHIIEVSVRPVAVGMYGNYVTYENLHTTMATYANMNMSSAYNFVTVNKCWSDKSAERGIYMADGQHLENNLTVTNNLVDWNMQDGIKISVQGNGYMIAGNEVHHNAFSNGTNLYTGGIYIATANSTFPRQTNVVTENNLVHENGPLTNPKACLTCGNGIWYDTIGTGSIIRNNTAWGNTAAGIDVEYVGTQGGQSIENNTTYKNGQYGILLTRRSHGVVISNNTSYQNFHNIQVIGECGGDPVGMVGNLVKDNTTWGGAANELVATCGAANEGLNGAGNTYENNNLGKQRSGFIYYGKANFSTYPAWLAFANPAASGSF